MVTASGPAALGRPARVAVGVAAVAGVGDRSQLALAATE